MSFYCEQNLFQIKSHLKFMHQEPHEGEGVVLNLNSFSWTMKHMDFVAGVEVESEVGRLRRGRQVVLEVEVLDHLIVDVDPNVVCVVHVAFVDDGREEEAVRAGYWSEEVAACRVNGVVGVEDFDPVCDDCWKYYQLDICTLDCRQNKTFILKLSTKFNIR